MNEVNILLEDFKSLIKDSEKLRFIENYYKNSTYVPNEIKIVLGIDEKK